MNKTKNDLAEATGVKAKVVLPAGPIPQGRHRLDPARIIETAENLARDIGEKLPGSSLAGLAVELAHIAHATVERTQQARRPIYAIRVLSSTSST